MNEGQTLESKVTQSVCAQCGSRLSATAGEDDICINCLLRSAIGENDVDDEKIPRHSDQSIQGDDDAPIEFGDYELLEEIGRGSQGVVYRARQKSLNRIVALKVIALGHWATEPHVKRFRREAEAAARLNHPGIVPIYEVGKRDGACYFSMGLVEGGQLDAMLEREPMPIRSAVELIVKLARTVQYAHEHNILHRDIKPGNILLDAKGEPHLTDFGLARLVEAESTVTRTREVLGTPSYMAPEQAAGETTKLGKATDVYGLGAVLYQLLTGHPPFAGGTSYETIRLLLNTEPRKPRALNRKIDRDLSTICLKCLEKEPQRRYSSAFDLAEDLEHWLKHEPIHAKRSGFFTHARKWVRRNPTSGLLAASIMALATAAGWIVWKSEFIPHPVTNGIAVLPFENLSEDKGNAYFATGIQDEILTRLANLRALKVISRTSTEKYPSRPQNLKTIAAELGVATVLEGSVQKLANEAHINVQLINALTGAHIWAQSYDRALEHVFTVQGEVAQSVADALKVKLLPAQIEKLNALPTQNPKAYDLFLKGEYARDRAWKSGGYEQTLNPGINYFREAVALDPQFALAFAQLAQTQLTAYHFGVIDYSATQRPELLASARENIDRALRLEPDLPAAHSALGYWHYWGKSDYDAGFGEWKRALAVDPRLLEAGLGIGAIEIRRGRPDEAIEHYSKMLEFDPRDLLLLRQLATCYRMRKDYAHSVELLSRAVALDPASAIDAGNLSQSIIRASGDIRAASNVLDAVPVELQKNESVAERRVDLLMFGRDFTAAEKIVESLPPENWRSSWRRPLLLGKIQRALVQEELARESFQQARTLLIAAIAKDSEEPLMHADLAQADAGLGLEGEALREADRAIDLQPTDKDAWIGSVWLENRAEVNAQLGRTDEAIKLIERLLAMPNDSLSVWELKLEPVWDPLRGESRFQELCQDKLDKSIAVQKAATR
jgi:serine/threonine protein kinase/Flp pilus assembly protein TadD